MTNRAPNDREPKAGRVGRPSDEALMERFCRGEGDAFDALFSRHAKALYLYLLRMVSNEALAEDLLQATFLAFVRARRSYQAGSRVAPWLYSIAANAARDSRRRLQRCLEESTPNGRAPAQGGFVEPSPIDPGLSRLVKQALEQLPPAQREAVLLHRFHELSFAEIAAAAGTSEGAAKVRAHRGYEKLRTLLKNF
jgi:RNA polymerase sigma-70 factor (ECF subfamily)